MSTCPPSVRQPHIRQGCTRTLAVGLMRVSTYLSKPVKLLIAIRTHPAIWVVILFACACTTEPTGGPLIRVILPDLPADAIYLVMDQSGDETVPDESLRLSGPDRRGVWHIPVRQLTGKFDRPADTLMIRFSAWSNGKSIPLDDPKRRAPLHYLMDHEPVFTYGEPWLPGRVVPAVFRVNMANQQVLGFFDPGRGDRVFVTGPWYGWPEQGRELQPAGVDMGIWELETEVRYLQDEPPGYRYRIESSRDIVLPNKGLETFPPRRLKTDHQQVRDDSPDWFNGQKRVVRFVIDEQTLTFQPGQNTPLRIRLELDGRTVDSDLLVRTGPGLWETALMIPEAVEVIKWALVVGNGGGTVNYEMLEANNDGTLKLIRLNNELSLQTFM
ncbi:MAG: hypothetical protein ACNA8K_13045 [Cyclonatronaceae bacterium]